MFLASTVLLLLILGGCNTETTDSGVNPKEEIISGKPSTSNANPKIAYVDLDGYTISGNNTVPTIAVMDEDGSDIANVYISDDATLFLWTPTWSASSSEIVFAEQNGSTDNISTLMKISVSVSNGVATGGTPTTLVSYDADADSVFIQGCSWSASTSDPAIAYFTEDHFRRIGGEYIPSYMITSKIYTISPSGGSPTEIYSVNSQIDQLTWSPDGSKLAFGEFHVYSDNTIERSIKIINTQGEVLDSIPFITGWMAGSQMDWSNSGLNKIVVGVRTSTSNGYQYGIYTVDPSTSTTWTYVTEGRYPAWSADNTKLVYYGPKSRNGWGTNTYTMSSGSKTTIANLYGIYYDWKP